ncbi:unnamed protein product [Ilex paraguariensis]|uniref:Uncharacterized protein n=1 Tax=Ilex paraguariensis TaxID=185542 RepID=A0ABC8TSQ6_9AQUA
MKITRTQIGESLGFIRNHRQLLGRLEALEGFLVGPGLDGEIGLGVEPNAEDDDGEEARDVAWQLPVLPLPRLTWWWQRSVQKIAVGAFLVAGSGPPAWAISATSSDAKGGAQPCSEHACGAREGLWGRHFWRREKERLRESLTWIWLCQGWSCVSVTDNYDVVVSCQLRISLSYNFISKTPS